jgi:hypothetical protein
MQTLKYLRRKAASAYLEEEWGLVRSPNYLAKLAVVGGGPGFHKGGLYSPSALDDWAEKIIGPEKKSTSDQPFRSDLVAGFASLPAKHCASDSPRSISPNNAESAGSVGPAAKPKGSAK